MTDPPQTPRVFSVADGRAHGLTRGRMRGPRFTAPFYGVRHVAAPDPAPDRSEARLAKYAPHVLEVRRLAEQYAPRLRPGQFYSHDTALALREAPMPDGWRPALHVRAYRPAHEPRTRGVHGHRLQERPPAWALRAGVPVEDPARAWVQVSRAWAQDDLIAAGDFLIARRRRLATLDELRAEAELLRGGACDAALHDLRDGAESFRETRLRLACRRAGLPEPLLNIDIFDDAGSFIARIDLLYPQYRVAAEYDGRQHADDPVQFARDADRWDAIRAAGWDHVRILRHHLEPDPARAVAKVSAALVAGGWQA